MIPARRRAYIFFTMKDVETLRRIGWHRAESDSVWGIFTKLSSSADANKTFFYASSGFSMSFLS